VNALRDIFELVLHYERGCWEEIGSAAAHLGMSEDAVPALYIESVDWAQQILSGRSEGESKPA
jgi:c-di-GMP-related signal transduction protein